MIYDHKQSPHLGWWASAPSSPGQRIPDSLPLPLLPFISHLKKASDSFLWVVPASCFYCWDSHLFPVLCHMQRPTGLWGFLTFSKVITVDRPPLDGPGFNLQTGVLGYPQRRPPGYWFKTIESFISWPATTPGVQDPSVAPNLSQGKILSTKTFSWASVNKNS